MTGTSIRVAKAHIQMYATGPAGPIRWRLLGGNNRELGRGTGEFIDVESCLLGVKHLRNVVPDLEVSMQRNEASAWGWLLRLGGVSVAASGHRYDRQIRCRQGVAAFAAALAECDVGRAVTFTHSRRWTSVHQTLGTHHRELR